MQTRPTSIYTTPALVAQQLQKALPDTPTTDVTNLYNDFYTLVQRYCKDYSKIIEGQINAAFVPYYAAKDYKFRTIITENQWYYDVLGGVYRLDLREDLLSIDSIVFNGTTLTSTQYDAMGMFGLADYPYRQIEFDATNLPSWDVQFTTKLTITGEWGVQDNSSDAYSTVTVTAEALDSSETGIDIANGSGTLFDVYQYIRIDDELMLITAITSSTAPDPDILTVTRGVNGFTAAAHDSGASITRWNVVYDVQELATRMVAYFFNKRDDTGERVQFINESVLIAQFSKELAAIAQRRKRNLYGVP
jgi:hypothetical protein